MAIDATVSDALPKPRRLGPLWRFLAQLFDPRHKLTGAERRELAAERLAAARLRSHEAGLRAEADLFADQLSEKLKDLGVCYEYRQRDNSPVRFKLVRFMRPYVLRDEAIYLKADLRPGRSPRGVGVQELSEPRVLENLSIAVGHPVSMRYTPERGFWYIIERELGKRGIPNHVKYDEVLSQRPASADGLALPLGVGSDKRVMWRSLSQMYSMLVAGTTGGGKSNAINAWVCALLRYNSARKLKLVLVDLKGGVEFTFYTNVPHLLSVPIDDKGNKASIIERREQVIPALEWLVKEGERRLEMLKGDRAKTIGQYNFNNRKSPLPHIVLVIDEWADVKLEPKLGARAEELLINISSRFRAVGIHVLLCTQVPNKDVVSIRVKNVLPARLAFACPNLPSSMLIVGDGSATGLEPAGRAIYDWGQTRCEIQTPYINNDTIDTIVAQAIKGEFDEGAAPAAHDVTDQEIFEWAVGEHGGFLDRADLYNQYRLRGMTKEYAETFCRRVEGQTVMVGSSAYTIMPASGSRPRRMLPIETAEEEQAEPAKPKEPITLERVAAWALENNEGRLNTKAVWEGLRDVGLGKRVAEAMLKQSDGQRVTVAGVEYRVLPPVNTAGRMHPRRLEPIPAPANPDTARPIPEPEPRIMPETLTSPAGQSAPGGLSEPLTEPADT